jgi:hypothetical protein
MNANKSSVRERARATHDDVYFGASTRKTRRARKNEQRTTKRAHQREKRDTEMACEACEDFLQQHSTIIKRKATLQT